MPLQVSGQVGPQVIGDGTGLQAFRQGKTGELIVQELHGKYYEQVYRGGVFSLSVTTAAAVTAFTGGAAGTPQICLYNPLGSGKNAFILTANVGNAVAASAAGTVMWGLYFGPTAAITQATLTVPRSHQTLQAAGSSMIGFTNVALTGSTAAVGVIPLGEYYWATAAGAFASPVQPADLGSLLCVPPGAYAALGGSSALTSATWIGNLSWEEVPV